VQKGKASCVGKSGGGDKPRCSGFPPTGPALQNKKNNTISTKFRKNLPCTGRFPKPARKMSA
jgi:hypothetical protein